ncbi:MAG: hypothetical protein KR126chlam6_00312 [Candidatus Anoxychlamydiales bacterium]|nr:hypothetical protein [Candidatus Anoxychlamydiales bacterium]
MKKYKKFTNNFSKNYKFQTIFLFLIFFIFSSFSISNFFYKKTFVYVETTLGKKTSSFWLIKKKKDDFIMTKTNDEGITNIHYSPKYRLRTFNYESATNNSNYEFSIEEKKLSLSGKTNGKTLSRNYTIYSKWVQDFNFGLRSFLKSKKQKYFFVIINPDDFSIHEMIATKEGIQKVRIDDTTYNTQKIEVTLPGFKSLFWKAEIYYDLETFDLVKYRANEGPGTPMNTTVLDSKK